MEKRSRIQPLDQHAAASLRKLERRNGEIAKLPDIFIPRAKEDGNTGKYVVCLYTAHLAEIAKFFFVFAGISNIQGKMIGQKDSLLEKYRTYLYSTKKRYE